MSPNLFAAARTASTAASLAPPGGVAVPPGSVPATDIFNYAALPSDVQL